MTDFLPEGYEAPQGGSSYFKLQPGENKLRILSKPIIGWLDWKDNKPYRFRFNRKPEKPLADKPIRHFWAMVVFDYSDNQVKIFEVTQSTIQKAIEDLAKNEDWGSPHTYDLKISKKGQEKNTEYSVMPSPKKDLTPEIKQAAKDRPVHLDALFEGKDPFIITNGEQTQMIHETLSF